MTNTTDFITSVYDELRRQLNVGNDNLGQKTGCGRGYQRRKGRHQAPL